MLKRKIYDNLIHWKKTKNKECLLLKGARQVGKTFIVEEFGKNEYSSYIYINFYLNPEYKNIFDQSLDANAIYKKMAMYIDGIKLIERDTLIFIDEIEECPNARTALKFLALDNRYDVIASGSLLGIHYKDIVSIPVGYERQLEMFSLDFEEFLWAMGINEVVLEELRRCFENKKTVEDVLNKKMLNLVHDYMVVGGMPEAVNTFLKTQNYQEVNVVQNKIIDSYRDDAIKYADKPNKQKIIKCFDSIPAQLTKDYTKFQYKTIETNGNAKKYEDSLMWLVDAGIIKKCYNVTLPSMPLVAFRQLDTFKVYMTDIGILTCLFGLQTQLMLLKNGIKNTGKGGLYENLVFDMLVKKRINLSYYKNKNNTQEIEFVYEEDGNVVPVEVKSKNGTTISLNNFIEHYNPSVAYKVILGNIGNDGVKVTLPYYMLMFL